MELRRVPGGASRTLRLKTLLAVVVIAISSGVLLGVGDPATAASAAPSVYVQVSGTETASVSGRTKSASPRVRFDRRAGSHWVLVKRIRAHAHRFATTLSVVAGTSATFRVTSDGSSRKFVVAMPARVAKPNPPSQPTLYDACGARPRKADGSAWSCTFDDEFNGTELDRTKWIPNTVFATGSADTYTCYRDDPSNVNVANGSLTLTLLRLDQPAPCGVAGMGPTPLQSGMVSTWHRFSQQYGRIEARVKNTASAYPGLAEGFWMWPDDRVASTDVWPTAGEIDIAETFSVYPDAMSSTLHYSEDANGMRLGFNYNVCQVHRGEWNTYALEWTSTRIEFFVNGHSCLVNTSGSTAFQKPYTIIFTQGIGPGEMGNLPVAGTPIPATFKVDYVHAWQ
ncbi:beta-glucanase (GH16 family) [Marmoricola sp. URHA0025 HA25]